MICMKALKVESGHTLQASVIPNTHSSSAQEFCPGEVTRLPGRGSWYQLAIPKSQAKSRSPGPHSSSISLLWKKPKEELTKTVMGLVMWHSDTEPLLGVSGGEVTLTSQKHRTEKDWKRSSFHSPLGNKTLLSLPEEPETDAPPLSGTSASVFVPKWRRFSSNWSSYSTLVYCYLSSRKMN